jgi:hypothetical protein
MPCIALRRGKVSALGIQISSLRIFCARFNEECRGNYHNKLPLSVPYMGLLFADQTPVWWTWGSWVSVLFYSTQALGVNEFRSNQWNKVSVSYAPALKSKFYYNATYSIPYRKTATLLSKP